MSARGRIAQGLAVAGALLLCISAGALDGCYSPTEATVEITSNVPCSGQLRTAIYVADPADLETSLPTSTTNDCVDAQPRTKIGSLVMVPSGARDQRLAVKVVTTVGGTKDPTECKPGDTKQCIIARRVLRYIAHENLRLPVEMSSACIDHPCEATETCVLGSCKPADIEDPRFCDEQTCPPVIPGDDGGSDANADADAADTGGDAGDSGPSTAGLEIVAGANHTCALADGRVRCWGSNTTGELGVGDLLGHPNPGAFVTLLAPAVHIVAGGGHTCALLTSGTVQCWGSNASSELGDSDPTAHTTPRPVDLGGMQAAQIAAGGIHTCALVNMKARCWGTSALGGLGYESMLPQPSSANAPPVNLGGPAPASLVAVTHRTCAIFGDRSAKCWGKNNERELGVTLTGNLGDQTGEMGAALPFMLASDLLELALGYEHTCTRDGSGFVTCWGRNDKGQLGTAPGASVAIGAAPKLPFTARVTVMAAGTNHTCAALLDGKLYCWGEATAGKLGRGDTAKTVLDLADVVDLGPGANVIALALGQNHTCAMRADRSVKCWGENFHNQLGLGLQPGDNRGDAPNEMGNTLPSVPLGL